VRQVATKQLLGAVAAVGLYRQSLSCTSYFTDRVALFLVHHSEGPP